MGYADLHELAKGWKASIARATDPATKYVYIVSITRDKALVGMTNEV